MTEDEAQRPKPPVPRQGAGRVLSPVVAVLAFIYFLVDALFLPPMRLLGRWLGGFMLFARLGEWIRTLGPSQSVAVLVIGEILKVTIVERLFHVGRPKLMMIPAFAWTYDYVMAWYAWLEALPPWQAVKRHLQAIKAQARTVWLRLGGWVR